MSLHLEQVGSTAPSNTARTRADTARISGSNILGGRGYKAVKNISFRTTQAHIHHTVSASQRT